MSFTVELKVPPDTAFVSLIERIVEDACSRGQLAKDEREAALAVARLGFTTIVETAMAEAREPIRLIVRCTPVNLGLSFFERGLPIDDALARRDPQWSAIVRHADEAHWHSHGSSGSELRLAIARPHGIAAADAPLPASAGVPLAPEQPYEIRRFVPADAAGIARAFYLTYGYHYDLPAVYVPERLRELNVQGRYVSIVAVAQDGEIAGHYALSRDEGAPIADACGAVVLPAHRGRDLLNRLRAHAEEEAISLGLAAYYSEPVTDHGRTQHASESFGAIACGLTLGESPRTFVAKHMELSTTTQRQSFMLYVKRLRERETRTIYPPRRHRDMIERLYRRLELPVVAREGSASTESGSFRTSVERADEIGSVTVHRASTIDEPRILQAIDDLRAACRLGALYVWLPLEDSATPVLCEALERYGFFFSGLCPWMLDGRDALRLQMPLTPIDLRGLTVVSDSGKELLAYVDAERARCAVPKECVS